MIKSIDTKEKTVYNQSNPKTKGGGPVFSYEEIQKFNETDIHIYKYILSNIEKVQYMTIRELSGELHTSPPLEDLKELSSFFERTNSSAFEQKLSFAVDAIKKAELVIFLGIGSSGTLAKYGARYFSNMGKFSIGLEDSYYPIDIYRVDHMLLAL